MSEPSEATTESTEGNVASPSSGATGLPPERVNARDDADTVGTGSVVAVGCSVATAVLIVLGILIILLTRWL